MTGHQSPPAGHHFPPRAPNRILAWALVLSLTYLLWSCAGLPAPGSPIPSDKPAPEDTQPWFKIYPARWYDDHQAACSITFDDGTLDQYLLAAPELDIRGIKGTFFIITGPRAEGFWKDGTTNRLLFNWDQARELHARGHEIASHTANHVDLRAHPQLAELEIERAYWSLRRELSLNHLFSLGWPYWRSSPTAQEQARRFHYAARAGGIQGAGGAPHLGGPKGGSPENYMMIGSRAILSSDTIEKLTPIFNEAYDQGGWLVPSFHGIDDGLITPLALGWEALDLATFRQLLEELAGYGFWLAPFGTVAKYAQQRDELHLEAEQKGSRLRLQYSSPLDPSVFNHRLTLIVELSPAYRLNSVVDTLRKEPLDFRPSGTASLGRYLVELPPGDGQLLMRVVRNPR